MARRIPLLVALVVGGTVTLAPGVAAGGSCHPDPEAVMTTSAKQTVFVDRCAFAQTVTYVDPGETVRWVNKDVFPHTVTGAASSWGDAEMLDQGDEVSYAFDEEGVFPYYCELHPSMVGAVVVGDGGGPRTAAVGGVRAGTNAAPAAGTAPADSRDGLSPAVLALAAAAAAGAVVAGTRYVLGRRTSAVSAS